MRQRPLTIVLVLMLALASSAGVGSYTIRAGDTLGGVAKRFGTTVETLVRLNRISDPDHIWVGEVLALPGVGPNTYTVARGDTLGALASRFGLPLDTLASANGIDDVDHIALGRVLTVPQGATPTTAAGGRAAASAASTASTASTASSGRGAVLDLEPIVAVTTTGSRSGGTQVVRPGDTLSGIAARLGVTTAALAAANGLADADLVYVGQVLTVPARSGASRAPVVSASSKLPSALLAHPERLVLLPRFDAWAATYGVPADLLKALSWMESGWQNSVVSSVGARGIGQLTPDTVRFVADQLLRTNLDPDVPDDNIRMSARFLSYLLAQTGGDSRSALAAYYQGLDSLRRLGVLPVSTLYVDDITALRPMFT